MGNIILTSYFSISGLFGLIKMFAIYIYVYLHVKKHKIKN